MMVGNDQSSSSNMMVVARPADSVQGHLDKLPGVVDVLDWAFRWPHPNAAKDKLNLELQVRAVGLPGGQLEHGEHVPQAPFQILPGRHRIRRDIAEKRRRSDRHGI